MPTTQTGTHRITVRRSPSKIGHLEFTVDGKVLVELNRNDAMIASEMLIATAYEMPDVGPDAIETVWANVPPGHCHCGWKPREGVIGGETLAEHQAFPH